MLQFFLAQRYIQYSLSKTKNPSRAMSHCVFVINANILRINLTIRLSFLNEIKRNENAIKLKPS